MTSWGLVKKINASEFFISAILPESGHEATGSRSNMLLNGLMSNTDHTFLNTRICVLLTVLLMWLTIFPAQGQENVTTLGVQVKPMLPSKFFGTGPEQSSAEDLTVLFTPEFGMNFG